MPTNIFHLEGGERRIGYYNEDSQRLLRRLRQANSKTSLLVERSGGIAQVPISAFLYGVDSSMVEVDGWLEWLIRLLAPRAHVEKFAQSLLSRLSSLECSAAEWESSPIVVARCLTEILHLIARCQHPECQRAACIIKTLLPR